MSNIHVFATWKVKEGSLETVLNLIQELKIKSENEEGNLFYNAHQSIEDKNVIILHEAYLGQNAIESHKNSEHFKSLVLEQIVPLLEERKVTLASAI
ncbi:putative quinol monooxygenase [Marinigracilibium pacificum]|uniref:Antibiotic biosynthesis monooxygenase n=1 Tax=Marinigracilibium pacificum TaxID=2729599 RepID=A0A848J563_9BACT|nr:putative quinol monooxygenase [Marinigracilibium pacificum]NMM48292.1 antibiotic biosynthesis monooxygenase [Marinigracilibium pacificum]